MNDSAIELIIHRVTSQNGPCETIRIPTASLPSIPQKDDFINFDWSGGARSKGVVSERYFGVSKNQDGIAHVNRVEIFVNDFEEKSCEPSP